MSLAPCDLAPVERLFPASTPESWTTTTVLSCRERSAIYWLRPTRPVLTIGTSIKRPKTQLRAIGSGLATSVVVWNSIDQQRKRIEACSGGGERECGIALCDVQTFAVERLPIFFPLAGLASPYSKWRATHRRIDSIEDLQTNNVRYSTDGDRIAEIDDLAIGVKRRPHGHALAVRIARSREVDPVAGHFLGHFPICHAPVPRRLIEMIEDIPELGEVARAPTFVHRADRERWLLCKQVVVDAAVSRSGFQSRPSPHVPAEAEISLEAEPSLARRFRA